MDKGNFGTDVTGMMNTDSNWHGSGHRSFTQPELDTFIGHLWTYVNEKWPVEEQALTFALLKTDHMASAQDRARAIKKKLQP